MKAFNKICRYAAVVFGLASLVLFFTDFATIVTSGTKVSFVATQLAFGSEVTIGKTLVDMHKSADIFVCFFLTLAGVAASFFAMKSKKGRYAASAIGLGAFIYTLVIAASDPTNYIDKRPLPNVTGMEYSPLVWVLVAALFLFTVISIAYLLIDDYLEVKASNGEKLTIPKRVIRFFRDYKSEVKKIVWPGPREVVKNTLIVLAMCLIVGILIWVVDFGLGKLLGIILDLKK